MSINYHLSKIQQYPWANQSLLYRYKVLPSYVNLQFGKIARLLINPGLRMQEVIGNMINLSPRTSYLLIAISPTKNWINFCQTIEGININERCNTRVLCSFVLVCIKLHRDFINDLNLCIDCISGWMAVVSLCIKWCSATYYFQIECIFSLLAEYRIALGNLYQRFLFRKHVVYFFFAHIFDQLSFDYNTTKIRHSFIWIFYLTTRPKS